VPKSGYVAITLKKETWYALRQLSREWGVSTSEAVRRLVLYRDLAGRVEALEARLGRVEEKLDMVLKLLLQDASRRYSAV